MRIMVVLPAARGLQPAVEEERRAEVGRRVGEDRFQVLALNEQVPYQRQSHLAVALDIPASTLLYSQRRLLLVWRLSTARGAWERGGRPRATRGLDVVGAPQTDPASDRCPAAPGVGVA